MTAAWTVIVSREVRQWFDQQAQADQIIVCKVIERLRTQGNRLRMSHSKSLGGGLYELRFSVNAGRVDQRITYVFDVERRVITLITFSKTRNNGRRQVQRARDAQKDYERRNGS